MNEPREVSALADCGGGWVGRGGPGGFSWPALPSLILLQPEEFIPYPQGPSRDPEQDQAGGKGATGHVVSGEQRQQLDLVGQF